MLFLFYSRPHGNERERQLFQLEATSTVVSLLSLSRGIYHLFKIFKTTLKLPQDEDFSNAEEEQNHGKVMEGGARISPTGTPVKRAQYRTNKTETSKQPQDPGWM